MLFILLKGATHFLKKTKTYEISVIDKTYSKTISDETKFYTSDTALELGFELKETEYTFESAEIVLLNIDDRSLVTRPVTKVLNSFIYELEDDIIAHYGEWRGQLRFEQAGETYVSSPVKFRIENDLSNDRPPQLSDVQSWVSLKRYADKLTDELKQAVLSVDGIEDTFNENETERQTTFETAEQSRQGTFETNEIERTETFESNEDVRKAQELEREIAEETRQEAETQRVSAESSRVSAESYRVLSENERETNETKRQTIFETNESERDGTFSTNETVRQENETTRQQAETQRATAESSRVSAEAQRKADHANRSAELAGKANKKQEDWITPTLLNGWVRQDSSQTPEYMKDEFGFVHFRGCIKGGTAPLVFNLPEGYRPRSTRRFPVTSGDSTIQNMLINNNLVQIRGNPSAYAYLDNVTFEAGK